MQRNWYSAVLATVALLAATVYQSRMTAAAGADNAAKNENLATSAIDAVLPQLLCPAGVVLDADKVDPSSSSSPDDVRRFNVLAIDGQFTFQTDCLRPIATVAYPMFAALAAGFSVGANQSTSADAQRCFGNIRTNAGGRFRALIPYAEAAAERSLIFDVCTEPAIACVAVSTTLPGSSSTSGYVWRPPPTWRKCSCWRRCREQFRSSVTRSTSPGAHLNRPPTTTRCR